MKKKFEISFLLGLALILSACGGSSPARSINGFWTANLANPDGSRAYEFLATLSQGMGSVVNVSGFGFSGPAPCFSAPTAQGATFSVSGSSGGFQTGPFGMSISTALGVDVENQITLSGHRNGDGTISGTWTLVGVSGCSGSGSYTMQLPPPV